MLGGLTDAQLSEASLCDGWTDKATPAHLTMMFHTSMRKGHGVDIRHLAHRAAHHGHRLGRR
jgi:hypothetical protein